MPAPSPYGAIVPNTLAISNGVATYNAAHCLDEYIKGRIRVTSDMKPRQAGINPKHINNDNSNHTTVILASIGSNQ